MADEIIFLQHWIFSKFLFPFLLIFFIVFAVLEKLKLFGEGKKQINALISFVIGLIFVGAVYPKLVVENLILFLTITIVAVFVVLLIWGFVFGEKIQGSKLEKGMKLGLGAVVTIAFIGALIWATGLGESLGTFMSGNNEIVQAVITNGVFLLVIVIALVLILIGSKKKK